MAARKTNLNKFQWRKEL